MRIISSGLKNGVYNDKYGRKGTEFNENGVPTCSIPFEILDAPKNAVSYALVLEDKDAYPVSGGFAWIHWTAANITKTEILENESILTTDFVQGVNSWTSMQGGNQKAEECSCYGGMCPPDAPHIYELYVYALDTTLDVKNGFLFNELHRKMDGHILEQSVLKGVYNC